MDFSLIQPKALPWQRPPDRVELRAGDLHLWSIPLDESGPDLDRCWLLLNAEQWVRTQSLRDPGLRARYARARGGLNLILGRYLGRPPNQIQFQYAPSGKPRLAGEDAWLSFSFTHSGKLALVALGTGPDAEVGIDCEQIRPRRDLLAIARRLFDPDTVADLEAIPEGERLGHFHLAWTALEARVKWDGRGLFGCISPNATFPQVANFIPAPGYSAAVARLQLPPIEEWLGFRLMGPEWA